MIDDYTSNMNQVERHSKAVKSLEKAKEMEQSLKDQGFRYKKVDAKTYKLKK